MVLVQFLPESLKHRHERGCGGVLDLRHLGVRALHLLPEIFDVAVNVTELSPDSTCDRGEVQLFAHGFGNPIHRAWQRYGRRVLLSTSPDPYHSRTNGCVCSAKLLLLDLRHVRFVSSFVFFQPLQTMPIDVTWLALTTCRISLVQAWLKLN